jgi:very-short-patch-repair endonuclease
VKSPLAPPSTKLRACFFKEGNVSEIGRKRVCLGIYFPLFEKGDQGGFLIMLQYDKHLKKYSRRLRNEMTDAERMLRSKIRGKQLKDFQVYRQKPIGRFVVDFYCPKAKLVIELDGGQHYSEAIQIKKDESRDRYMERIGLKVLRFSDKEVCENLTEVLEEIWNRA